MLQRFLCPVLVSREAELSTLEDALLAANRGDARIVLLEGEAGLGKSRLATALTERARKLGNVVLAGGCSEADVSLPYLPFVEAIGNYIATQEVSALGARLGPARQGLTQLFPQLAEGPMAEPGGDPLSVKLRLFESIVALLGIPAAERGLLLIVEDAHWADAATRELLDHIARRSTGMRVMVLVTYRIDEIDRKHPLLPMLQAWRRSGVAERVRIEPLAPDAAAAMIGAILDVEGVGTEFRDLLHARSEGNPFVLEEMLKEVVDRGDVFRTADGSWDRRAIEDIRIPESVRDTILLRVGRFEPDAIEVLRAASVLGRTFAYRTLVAVSAADESSVQRALQLAVGQQLVDEDATGSYRWRHALTQEAIYDDLVLPRRQALHSRAADVLAAATGTDAAAIAFHLLGAGRFAEAVPACLAAAAEAERTLAYEEAIDLYERALPHVDEPIEHGRLLCSLGIAYWRTARAGRAEPHLVEGISLLESAGHVHEIGRPLTVLGRCRWELNRSPEARADFERARAILEQGPPSADLAFAYIRIAGLHAFELEDDECIRNASRAIEIAEQVGADFERVWGMTFLALGLLGSGRVAEGFAVTDDVYRLATAAGYHIILSNTLYNDAWMCVHLMVDRLDAIVQRMSKLPPTDQFHSSATIMRSNISRVRGELDTALAESHEAEAMFARLGFAKFEWRARINTAEILYEMGRYDDAWRALPADGGSLDLQDIAYEAAVQLRLRAATGRLHEAIPLARRILDNVEKLAIHRETLGLGAETFLEAGMLDEAAAILTAARAHEIGVGGGFLDAAEARLALARGDVTAAADLAQRATAVASQASFRLDAMRAATTLGTAQAALGDPSAVATLQGVVDEAVARGAGTIAAAARAIASEHGFVLTEPAAARAQAEHVPVGERLITSMFADVRNYTEMTADTAPHEMAERIGTLYRWAAAEVERNDGVVNRFAGDAVMATFNVEGTNLDHTVDAVRAALTLRDKAALADLPIGIGIAVGPAVVGTVVEGQDMMVTGVATNLAARLQTAASAGEVILSEEAYRRVHTMLTEWGLDAVREELTLKGFEGTQVAYRVPARAGVAAM